jgi:2-polyprenyl-6-hydroxyphenyl methylase/3-demethylubiquinone-9 3-methyltransferase
MTGMVYNPLTRRYRMTDRDVDVNYMICVRKPI